MKDKRSNKVYSEDSFTLVETIIAAFLLAAVVLQVGQVQGNAVYFMDYGRKVTQASWLAKGTMSKVQYYAQTRPFADLNVTESNVEFKETGLEDFRLNISIEDFEMPIIEMIATFMNPQPSGDEDSEGSKPDDAIVGMIKQILGEELMKLAKVEVSWPEGAKRNSIELSLIVTNEKKFDEVLTQLGPVDAPKKTTPNPKATPTPTPTKKGT